MAIAVTLLSFGLGIAIGCAVLQPEPVPRAANRAEDAQANQAQADELRAIVAELRAIRDQIAAADKHRADEAARDGPPVWSNWALFGAAIVAGWFAYLNLRKLTRQTAAADRTARAAWMAERAYVTISHVTNLDFTREANGAWYWVEIRNHGKTPATVLGGKMAIELGAEGTAAPRVIPTRIFQMLPPAFLAPGGFYRFDSVAFTSEPGVFERTIAFHSSIGRTARTLVGRGKLTIKTCSEVVIVAATPATCGAGPVN